VAGGGELAVLSAQAAKIDAPALVAMSREITKTLVRFIAASSPHSRAFASVPGSFKKPDSA
jgi:hypothetical protein